MLAFSTCWNTSRHEDGEDIITEILELGFDHIELSHGMTITRMPGLERAYENKMFTCSGVHNFFPSPTEIMMDAPGAYEFTHFKDLERTRAFKNSLKTLEEAVRFDAKYVVLHMGRNHKMPKEKWSKVLEQMLKDGGSIDDRKFIKHRDKFIKKREKTAKFYMLRAMYYLEQLEIKAREYGLVLAVESRSHYEQVPTESEMQQMMEHFKDSPHVQYWHDFGHVHRKHNLGLLDHSEWLSSMSEHLYGGHLHDVQWPIRDHRVPFQGEINYEELMPHFKPEMPLVWELAPSRKAEDIKSALAQWKLAFPDS